MLRTPFRTHARSARSLQHAVERRGGALRRCALGLFALALSGALAAQITYPSVVLKSTAEIAAADGASFDYYGASVALRGDRALIGARADDDVLATSGSVYVRDRNFGGAGAWGQVTKLHASPPEDGAQFGAAVGIDGGWIVATAPYTTKGFDPGVGSAYIFSNPGLVQLNVATPSSALANQHFGNAVDVSAAMGRALVGSADWWGGVVPSTFKGAAYTIDLASGAQVHALFGDQTNNEQFGLSVAIGDGFYAVGAPGNAANKGAVFVFSAATGALVNKIVPADAASNDRFGTSLDIQSGVVAIGSPGHDGFIFDFGAIYLYDLATGSLVKKVAPYYSSGGGIGYSVALAGDELFTNQGGTSLSGGLQTCGVIHQMNWVYGYIVASHIPNALGGLCTDTIGDNLAFDGGTILTGDGLNGVGLVNKSGTAWVLNRIPIALAADRKITVAANPLAFTVRAGAPGMPCVLGITALDGVPLAAPFVLSVGVANASGQWVKSYPSTTGTAITVTFAAAGFDASSNLLLSNTFDVQFL